MTSAIATPVHVYSTPGTYQVCLTVFNSTGCTDQKCISIVLSDLILETSRILTVLLLTVGSSIFKSCTKKTFKTLLLTLFSF
mgnify:CR=1 FL=1